MHVCVFLGANPGKREEYTVAVAALGRALGQSGCTLVYGGGSAGLMGVLANNAHEAGAKVIGVITHELAPIERSGDGVGTVITVNTMHERQAKMHDLCDLYIACPGGIGTMAELTEVICWCKLDMHSKPIGLLNVCGYYDPLSTFLDHSVVEGFLPSKTHDLVVKHDDPETLLKHLLSLASAQEK